MSTFKTFKPFNRSLCIAPLKTFSNLGDGLNDLNGVSQRTVERLERVRRRRLNAGAISILAFAFILALATDAEAALAFRLAGTLIGSFFGGPIGGMIGGMVGGLIGGLIFPEKGQTMRGPRIQDKSVQSDSFGAHIHRLWGTDRIAAQIIFSSGLKPKKHKTEMGGKGMTPTSTSVTYTYSIDFIASFGRRAKGVKRVWADKKLIYDASGTADIKKKWAKLGKTFTVRDGNESQLPSALEESYHGAGQCSAHRGLFCLEFEDFQLANFANHPPLIEAEVFTEGEASFAKIASYTPPAAPYSWWVGSWGYIDPSGEVWAMYYPFATMYPYAGYARVFHWALDKPAAPVEESHVLWSDDVEQSASLAGYVRVRSDEPSAAAFGTNDSGISVSYFQLEQGTRIDILDSEVPGTRLPEIMVKYGEEIYVNFILFDGPLLCKFDLAGNLLASSTIIFTATGLETPTDTGRSESYLWALCGHTLLKLDPDTFELINQTDLSAITDTAVLGLAVISDSEQRIVSASGAGTKFWIIRDEGTPVLDQHDATNGYDGIRAFGKWGLRYINGIYVVDFGGYIGGFAAQIDFFAPSEAIEAIPHWKIVRDIAVMSGLDSVIESTPPAAGDIAVGELTDLEHGYTLTRAMTARDAIAQLQQCRFYDCREKDFKLDFPKRGKAPVASLPGADLAVRSSMSEPLPDRLTQTRARETESPLRVHVVYNNHEAAYQPGHEYAPRRNTDSRATETLHIALAITSVEAQQIADTVLAMRGLERETFQLKVSRKHSLIDAADNVEAVITET